VSSSAPNRPDLISLAGITSEFPDGFVPRCPGCKYDLTGLSESRCPECGTRFSIPTLLAAWQARKSATINDGDFYLAVLLSLIAWYPADISEPIVLVWRVPLLMGLWFLVWFWFRRRREEFREASEAHRLLWVWGPCISTAMGLAATPGLNVIVAAAMLAVGLLATVTSWRRSPVMTMFILTLALTIPVVVMALFGGALLMQGVAGRGLSQHWSFADYPRWYWQGVPGRARGISNPDAITIGSAILGIGLVGVVGVGVCWFRLARAFWARRAQAGNRASAATGRANNRRVRAP